ncbi:MAG TPA: tetratricopeptide repeat protein [Acidobacteriota bacterium]|nr:tetratricopeptide repeat protein [Acidobacteriota bacterium]
MTKTNLVYGMIGVIVGIILGAFIGSASLGPKQVAVASTPQVAPMTQQAAQPQQPTQQQQLPEGHPPINQAELQTELAQLQATLMKNPENQEALVSAANLSYDLQNYPQAVSYYEKALKKDPQNLSLMTDLGTSYYYSRQPDKAIEMYNRSLSIDPKHLQSLMNMGVVKMSIGDHAGAAEAWEKAVTYHPDMPKATEMKETIKKLRAVKS